MWTSSQCLSSFSEMVSRKYIIISLLLTVILLTGTVVSLQSSRDSDLTSPISQRLRSRDTVLTKTADPSLLVHALLDLSMRLTLIEIGQSFNSSSFSCGQGPPSHRSIPR